jgi:hypothetical protein
MILINAVSSSSGHIIEKLAGSTIIEAFAFVILRMRTIINRIKFNNNNNYRRRTLLNQESQLKGEMRRLKKRLNRLAEINL